MKIFLFFGGPRVQTEPSNGGEPVQGVATLS